MRRNLDFSGPYLKVERADKHIREVETLLGRFVADNQKRFLPKNQQRALKDGRTIQDAKPPRHFPTALGDAVHNLMASLDHAYCVLIEANRHTTTHRSSFPFSRKDWASVKGTIDGHIACGNGPSVSVRDYIGSEVQPYPGGKHKLLELRELDIGDKHQSILPTSADLYIRKAQLVDPKTRRVVMNIEDVQLGNPGISITGHVFKTEHDLKTVFDVTFGDGQPLEGERILPTVTMLRDNVVAVLNGLEKLI